jgi:hypothetical protein
VLVDPALHVREVVAAVDLVIVDDVGRGLLERDLTDSGPDWLAVVAGRLALPEQGLGDTDLG